MMARASLAASQNEFMAHVLEDARASPAGWTDRHAAGMSIYRNAYRARLVDALRDTYERTALYVGEDAFRAAAAHHVIIHPPRSWTLDNIGLNFSKTLAELFADNPEVAGLGWMEWAMHRAFVAADAEPMDAAGFSAAAADFQEDDWARMTLSFLPGLDQRGFAQDVGALWLGLGRDPAETPDIVIDGALTCIVWRDGMKPVFVQTGPVEGAMLSMMRGGATYGTVCEALIERLGEEEAVAEAGAMFGRWLNYGFIARLHRTVPA